MFVLMVLSWSAALFTAAMYRPPLHATEMAMGTGTGMSLPSHDCGGHVDGMQHSGPCCVLCLAMISPQVLPLESYTPPAPATPAPVRLRPVAHATDVGKPLPARAPPRPKSI